MLFVNKSIYNTQSKKSASFAVRMACVCAQFQKLLFQITSNFNNQPNLVVELFVLIYNQTNSFPREFLVPEAAALLQTEQDSPYGRPERRSDT